MTSPRFSVIIPTLNEEKFLPNLLASLAEQSLKNFEVIVVDGSSKDKTVAIAQEHKRNLSLRVIVSRQASLPLQRNLGGRAAKGDWLVFVDADSVLLPYFFDRVGDFIKKENPQIFTTWLRPDSEVPGDAMVALLGNLMVEGTLLFKRPQAPGPLTVMKSQVFELVNGYDESLSFGEDVDFGRRVYEQGIPLQILRETLYIWSLRRFRRQGTLRVIQTYAKAIFSVLLTKRPPKHIPGYIMGGHLYTEKRKSRSLLERYEKKLKRLMKELFE